MDRFGGFKHLLAGKTHWGWSEPRHLGFGCWPKGSTDVAAGLQ